MLFPWIAMRSVSVGLYWNKQVRDEVRHHITECSVGYLRLCLILGMKCQAIRRLEQIEEHGCLSFRNISQDAKSKSELKQVEQSGIFCNNLRKYYIGIMRVDNANSI